MKEDKAKSQSLYFIDDALNDDLDVKKQNTDEIKKSNSITIPKYEGVLTHDYMEER